MSRFVNELRGEFGSFWKNKAEEEIEKMSAEVANGQVTIDDDGVARNRIGRVLMEDQMEILSFTGWRFSEEATRKAREEEVAKSINARKKNVHESSAEEMFEMRAAFGKGTKVVDVISGRTIQL